MSDSAEKIYQLADRMDWEVETDRYGRLVIHTEVIDPNFDPKQARQMRAWEAKDRAERRSLRDR